MCSLDYIADPMLKGTALEKIKAEDLTPSDNKGEAGERRSSEDLQKMLWQILANNKDVLNSANQSLNKADKLLDLQYQMDLAKARRLQEEEAKKSGVLFNVNNNRFQALAQPSGTPVSRWDKKTKEFAKWHGLKMGALLKAGADGKSQNVWEGLKSPECICVNEQANRPGYRSRSMSEYKDDAATLDRKLDVVADVIRRAAAKKWFVVYTGAGISTSAGLGDYASVRNAKSAIHNLGQSSNAKEVEKQRKLMAFRQTDPKAKAQASAMRLALKPTLSHLCIASMERHGFCNHWLQQNHDRLAQKWGYPAEKLNEIHGGWWDRENPVVKMSGSLRSLIKSE